MGITASSHRPNIIIIRLAAAGWVRKQIKLGVQADWNAAARGAKLTKEVRGTNLWLDSTDLAKVSRRTTSRKSICLVVQEE